MNRIELRYGFVLFFSSFFKYVFYRSYIPLCMHVSVFNKHKIIFCLQLNSRSFSMYFFASFFFSIVYFNIYLYLFIYVKFFCYLLYSWCSQRIACRLICKQCESRACILNELYISEHVRTCVPLRIRTQIYLTWAFFEFSSKCIRHACVWVCEIHTVNVWIIYHLIVTNWTQNPNQIFAIHQTIWC